MAKDSYHISDPAIREAVALSLGVKQSTVNLEFTADEADAVHHLLYNAIYPDYTPVPVTARQREVAKLALAKLATWRANRSC
jgi:hypothetical protein